MIVSDDVAVSFTANKDDPSTNAMASIVAEQAERIIEQSDAKALTRDKVRDAAVDGDGLVYYYFDPDAETGQDAKGEIRMEGIENINFHPANPYIHGIQDQPYIIISKRQMVEEIKREAEDNGVDTNEIDQIRADDDTNQGERGDNSKLATVLIKLWKKDGQIWAIKSTQDVIIRKEWATGYKLYPIASMRWERIKSQFFGQSMLTGLIPNQIAVNRLFAMTIRSVEMNAFPKVVYDIQKFPKGWSNRVGEAIGTTMLTAQDRFFDVLRGGDVSAQVIDIIERIVTMTRDFMGASDAALGNVKPDNTSAIIAVQQASAVPLSLQQREYNHFVEDQARIMVDMMRANYGNRTVLVDDDEILQALIQVQEGQELPKSAEIMVDFGQVLENANLRLNVDVGASAYWSELMQTQIMDNLFKAGLLRDAVTYIESIPNHMLKNKNKILRAVKRQQEAAEKEGQLQALLESQQETPSPEAALQ
jgi:hypothetical protein